MTPADGQRVRLRERVGPQHCAVIVVDVQNDFCADGGFIDRQGEDVSRVQEMVPRLHELLSAAREAGTRIVFVRSVYASDAGWYLSPAWTSPDRGVVGAGSYELCAEHGWGAEFYEVGPASPARELVVHKHRHSAFYNTPLETVLRATGVRTVVLTGVATNVCVESTARDALMRDFFVVAVSDCCAAYREHEHEAALWNIGRYVGQVVSSAQLRAAWAADPRTPEPLTP